MGWNGGTGEISNRGASYESVCVNCRWRMGVREMMSDDDDDCGCRDRNEERKSFLLIFLFLRFCDPEVVVFFGKFSNLIKLHTVQYTTNNALQNEPVIFLRRDHFTCIQSNNYCKTHTAGVVSKIKNRVRRVLNWCHR